MRENNTDNSVVLEFLDKPNLALKSFDGSRIPQQERLLCKNGAIRFSNAPADHAEPASSQLPTVSEFSHVDQLAFT